MYYRTRTYIAGDWTGDSDLIEQLSKINLVVEYVSERYDDYFRVLDNE